MAAVKLQVRDASGSTVLGSLDITAAQVARIQAGIGRELNNQDAAPASDAQVLDFLRGHLRKVALMDAARGLQDTQTQAETVLVSEGW